MSLDLISELGDIKVGEDLSKYKDKLVALGYRNPTSGRNSIASFVLAAALPDNFKKDYRSSWWYCCSAKFRL